MGDGWGSHYKDEEEGVSVAISFTEKGNIILRQCNICRENQPLEIVTEYQMKQSPQLPPYHALLLKKISSPQIEIQEIPEIIKNLQWRFRQLKRIRSPFKTIINYIKRKLNENKNNNLS